jgi:hypothetical protein
MWINIILCIIVFVAAIWWFYVEYFATAEQLDKIKAAKEAAFEYAQQTGKVLSAERFTDVGSVNSPTSLYKSVRYRQNLSKEGYMPLLE